MSVQEKAFAIVTLWVMIFNLYYSIDCIRSHKGDHWWRWWRNYFSATITVLGLTLWILTYSM